MIRLIIFDVDDTLCMTEEACFHLENDAASRMGFAPMARSIHQKNWGHPLEDAVKERFPGIDAPKFVEVLAGLIPEYVNAQKMDVITTSNLAVLDSLRASGFSIAVVTSRSLREVEHFLAQDHPLHGRIDAFYHKDNTKYQKPNPQVFDEVISEFQITPSEAIYVGDSVGDAQSAKAAGLYFIGSLESGLRTEQDFLGLEVDEFVDSFTNLVPAVEAISKRAK